MTMEDVISSRNGRNGGNRLDASAIVHLEPGRILATSMTAGFIRLLGLEGSSEGASHLDLSGILDFGERSPRIFEGPESCLRGTCLDSGSGSALTYSLEPLTILAHDDP
ncbi:hypothetical protein JW921_03395, partial [Candidatus Fermentibacterales bacterium]|nr:hypothetical protein [Candidatus Fermentibacterales bacterium]